LIGEIGVGIKFFLTAIHQVLYFSSGEEGKTLPKDFVAVFLLPHVIIKG
jgi:hypothetical protein